MRRAAAFFLLLLAAPARGQVGVGLSPDSLGLGRPSRRSQRLPAAASALDRVFGPEVWAAVEISTAGPAADLAQLSREGFYKLEMIQLVMIAAESRRPLSRILEKRRKEEKLSQIASGLGLDYDKLYDESLAVQEIVEREYLPRFEEPRGAGARP